VGGFGWGGGCVVWVEWGGGGGGRSANGGRIDGHAQAGQ